MRRFERNRRNQCAFVHKSKGGLQLKEREREEDFIQFNYAMIMDKMLYTIARPCFDAHLWILLGRLVISAQNYAFYFNYWCVVVGFLILSSIYVYGSSRNTYLVFVRVCSDGSSRSLKLYSIRCRLLVSSIRSIADDLNATFYCVIKDTMYCNCVYTINAFKEFQL